MKKTNYFSYWGKLAKTLYKDQELSFHPLVYHSLDVAAVVQVFLSKKQQLTADMAQFLQLSEQELIQLLVLFAALHDLGKFSAAFQALNKNDIQGLHKPNSRALYDARVAHHDRLGAVFWDQIKHVFLAHLTPSDRELTRKETRQALKALSMLAGGTLGHHGRPIDSSNLKTLAIDYMEPANQQAVDSFFSELIHLFPIAILVDRLIDESFYLKVKQLSWLIAGIVVLADWLGSDTRYFHYHAATLPLEEYWSYALKRAEQALTETELVSEVAVNPFISVETHFGFNPSPLQRWAESVAIDQSPQLFILEDVTGAGKTEAALVLTHRLLEAGAADGFYFGLPTMACSPRKRG